MDDVKNWQEPRDHPDLTVLARNKNLGGDTKFWDNLSKHESL